MLEGRNPECSHGDPLEMVMSLEQQLQAQALAQTETAQNVDDTRTQLELMRQLAKMYQEQVTRMLKLTEGQTGYEGTWKERERNKKGIDIASFSGEDRKELSRWKVKLALKITGKPKMVNIEQMKLKYTVNRIKRIALVHIMPYCDEVSREVIRNVLKFLFQMLELTFGDRHQADTTK
jgi:hypothetical protein